jgi:acyl-CoA synthetase (AMP-forming)/AMP-acid ligase II
MQTNPARIRQMAADMPEALAYVHVAIDGAESAWTWAELDCRSSQLAGALLGRGLGVGDRLGLGLRNSPEFVLAVFAAWKLGAVPVPIRWDVPDWELQRLRSVIDARIYLDESDLRWIASTSELDVPALSDAQSPYSNGICSGGSTGTPKVIPRDQPSVFDPLLAPLMEGWQPVSRPQTILVLAPMYHANGFATLSSLLAGDRLVGLDKFDAARTVDVIERHGVTTFTATPTMLQRVAVTFPVSASATCRASIGSFKARRRCHLRWSSDGRTSSASSASISRQTSCGGSWTSLTQQPECNVASRQDRNISTADEAHRADSSPNSCAAHVTTRSRIASASPGRGQ